MPLGSAAAEPAEPGEPTKPTGGPERPGLKGEITVLEPTRVQRALARRAAETRATIPDLELGIDVDAEPALAAVRDCGCSLTAVIVRACALALREHPGVNAGYRDGHYELYSRVNVAVTVQTDQATLTPTLLDADTKPLSQLSAELDAFTARARSGELGPPELAGATFTVTNLGQTGVTWASALVTAPQAAGVAAGAVRAVPVLRGGAVVPGHTIGLTLACDSRILFAAAAGRFLTTVAARLERCTRGD